MSSTDWSSEFPFVPPFEFDVGKRSELFPRALHVLATWGCCEAYDNLLADARRKADSLVRSAVSPIIGEAAKPYSIPIDYIEEQKGRAEYLLEFLLELRWAEIVPVIGRERLSCDYRKMKFAWDKIPIPMFGKLDKGKGLRPFGAAILTALAAKPGVVQSVAEILAYIARLPGAHLIDEEAKFSGNVDHVRKAISDYTGIDKRILTDEIIQCVNHRQGLWLLNLTPQEVRFVAPPLMPTAESSKSGTLSTDSTAF